MSFPFHMRTECKKICEMSSGNQTDMKTLDKLLDSIFCSYRDKYEKNLRYEILTFIKFETCIFKCACNGSRGIFCFIPTYVPIIKDVKYFNKCLDVKYKDVIIDICEEINEVENEINIPKFDTDSYLINSEN